jgi:hypothetical protein
MKILTMVIWYDVLIRMAGLGLELSINFLKHKTRIGPFLALLLGVLSDFRLVMSCSSTLF